jgi:hypothetical protein
MRVGLYEYRRSITDSQIVVNLILFTGSEQGKAPGKEVRPRFSLFCTTIRVLKPSPHEPWGRILCHPKRFSRAALALNSNRSNRRNNLDVLHNCEES